ncbi:alkylation response protein AidB-like acyl-CoA dehydrogenase [Undibacterium sp. GrIS 1.2]|uniref:acyl-CoA dehydrogenase family protein n=1 Tax=Undibacterium sp. GrIS 1.2 TaxID=3143933 RepID=UPI00339A9B29
MDFTFTEEQTMLQDATRRFIANEASFDIRRKTLEKQSHSFNSAIWQGFAELGLLALHMPEAEGGLDGTATDTLLVMSAIGEGLVLEPYLASAVLASKAIATMGNAQQRDDHLPQLASGAITAVLAHDEVSTRFDRLNVQTKATPVDGGYLLSGHKSVVPHGGAADILLVTARLPDDKLAVFILPKVATGLRVLSYATVDGVAAAELEFDQVSVKASAILAAANDTEVAIGNLLDIGLAAVCAEAIGVLDKLLAATIDYAKNRKQFGVVIGKFQALQHKMADMVLHIEQARSMAYLAAVSCEDPDLKSRSIALSSAKVVIGQACRFVGQQAVQLHGGMGVTDELNVSHYFKRLMAIELQFGSTDHHLEMVAGSLTESST